MKSEYGQVGHSTMNAIFKTPKRISITIPNEIHRLLLERSDLEGRSLSNLAAYLLESSISGANGSNGTNGSNGSNGFHGNHGTGSHGPHGAHGAHGA